MTGRCSGHWWLDAEHEALAGDERARPDPLELGGERVEGVIAARSIVVEQDQPAGPRGLAQADAFLPGGVPPAAEARIRLVGALSGPACPM
jgi:hypothetical protein